MSRSSAPKVRGLNWTSSGGRDGFFQLHRLPSWGQLRGCERRREGLCSSLRATAYFNTRAHDSPRAAEGHLESA